MCSKSGAELAAERRCDIATAKLGVAEQFQFIVAVPTSLLLYLQYDSWIVAATGGIAIFFLVVHWYTKEYEAANDAYEQLTCTGKYYKSSDHKSNT